MNVPHPLRLRHSTAPPRPALFVCRDGSWPWPGASSRAVICCCIFIRCAISRRKPCTTAVCRCGTHTHLWARRFWPTRKRACFIHSTRSDWLPVEQAVSFNIVLHLLLATATGRICAASPALGPLPHLRLGCLWAGRLSRRAGGALEPAAGSGLDAVDAPGRPPASGFRSAVTAHRGARRPVGVADSRRAHPVLYISGCAAWPLGKHRVARTRRQARAIAAPGALIMLAAAQSWPR